MMNDVFSSENEPPELRRCVFKREAADVVHALKSFQR